MGDGSHRKVWGRTLAWQVTLWVPGCSDPFRDLQPSHSGRLNWPKPPPPGLGHYVSTPDQGCLRLSPLPSQTSLIFSGPPAPGSPLGSLLRCLTAPTTCITHELPRAATTAHTPAGAGGSENPLPPDVDQSLLTPGQALLPLSPTVA